VGRGREGGLCTETGLCVCVRERESVCVCDAKLDGRRGAAYVDVGKRACQEVDSEGGGVYGVCWAREGVCGV